MTTIILNRTLAFVFALALLFGASIAYAEENTDGDTDGTTDTSTEVRPELFRPLPSEVREELRDRVEEKREEVRDRVEEKREEVRDAVGEKREELRDRVEEKRGEVREHVEERREKLKERGLDNARDRITTNAKRFIAVLEAGANRMQEIIGRIESHMEKLGDDVDTSVAQSHLDNAKESLRAVFVKLGDIKGEADSASDETTPKEDIEKIKELLRAAHQDLKDARESIRLAVQALKDAVPPPSTDDSGEAE